MNQALIDEADKLASVVLDRMRSSRDLTAFEATLPVFSVGLSDPQLDAIRRQLKSALTTEGFTPIVIVSRPQTLEEPAQLYVTFRVISDWFVVSRTLSEGTPIYRVTTLEDVRGSSPGIEFLVPTIEDGEGLAALLNGDSSYTWLSQVDDLNPKEILEAKEKLQEISKSWLSMGIVVKSWAPLGHGGFEGSTFI